MRFSISFAMFSVVLTASTAALADGPTFGSANQLAISSDANLQLTHTSYSDGGGSTTELTLRPAVDYFVIDQLSIGGFVLLDIDSPAGVSSQSVTTFGIGPRVGYNLTINDTFSFWPKLGVAFQHSSGGEISDTSFNVSIFAPFLVHPAPHFFLGLGPIFSQDLSNSVSAGNVSGDGAKATTFGLAFTVGGWVGL